MKHVDMKVNCWSLLITFHKIHIQRLFLPWVQLRQAWQAGVAVVLFLSKGPYRVYKNIKTLRDNVSVQALAIIHVSVKHYSNFQSAFLIQTIYIQI